MKIIENPEKILEIGDKIKISKIFIRDIPFAIDEVLTATVVNIFETPDGYKEIHLKRFEDDKKSNS